MHVKRILVLSSLATATLTAGSWFCTAQSATESSADQAALQPADALLKQMTLRSTSIRVGLRRITPREPLQNSCSQLPRSAPHTPASSFTTNRSADG
jgi:hypothetical protein